MNDPMDFACTVDGQKVDDTNRLRVLRMDEIEGELSPPLPDEAISRFEEVRDNGRFMQVRGLTIEKLRHMSAVEKRLLHEWVTRICDELDEKAGLIQRHMGAEPDVPDYLRAAGGA